MMMNMVDGDCDCASCDDGDDSYCDYDDASYCDCNADIDGDDNDDDEY